MVRDRAGRKGNGLAPSGGTQKEVKPASERRRSTRLALSVPVLAYGHNSGKEPFHEATQTICVNAAGGLLALAAPVEPGQMILLVNCNTQKEHRCRVVRVGPECDGGRMVGVEMIPAASGFWGVVYDTEQRVWHSG